MWHWILSLIRLLPFRFLHSLLGSVENNKLDKVNEEEIEKKSESSILNLDLKLGS